MPGTKYTIKRAKVDKEGVTYWKEVGSMVLDEKEGKGVLYLHLLDGEFKVFSDAFYERAAAKREGRK